MKAVSVSFLLVAAAMGFDINPSQPSIMPNGVINAASYISPGFSNYGIARGSLFLIFGVHLGPNTLVQAGSYPLPSSEGLAGTRVHINAGAYSGDALMVYTSATQVAAILPSTTPEGDATVTLNYRNLTSNPAVIRVVRSAFGAFTLNQAGTGQAVVQEFVSQTQMPLNTVLTSAAPGQTMILWGTGLGPVGGDEAAGPLPTPLPFLDTLYVGGQPATVRFAGRSGCCAGVDQVIFDVPAGVSGCYVPVVAVANGIASNAATIAVSTAGKECDDPLSFRASDLATLHQAGHLRMGTVTLWNEAQPGASIGSNTLSASFVSYSPSALVAAQAPVNPSPGSCGLTEYPVNFDPAALPHGDALNAGGSIVVSGPSGSVEADWVPPGNYQASITPAGLPPGSYTIASSGGPDMGPLRGTFTVAPFARWTNVTDYSNVRTGQPMAFQWAGGDSSAFVTIKISSANTAIASSIVCNLPASMGSFTVPAYLTRTIVPGQGNISVGFFGAPPSFAASGLDAGSITAGAITTIGVSFLLPTPGI